MSAERIGAGDRHYKLRLSTKIVALSGVAVLTLAIAYYGSKDPRGTEINPSMSPVADNLGKIPSAFPNSIIIPGFTFSPESTRTNNFSVNKSEAVPAVPANNPKSFSEPTPLRGNFSDSVLTGNNPTPGRKGVNVSDLPLTNPQAGVEVFRKQNPNGEDQTSGTWVINTKNSSVKKYPNTSKDSYSSNFQADTMKVNVAMWIPSLIYQDFSKSAVEFSNVFRWIDPGAQTLLNSGNATIIKFNIDKTSSQAQEYIHHNPKEDVLDIMPVPGVILESNRTTVLVAVMEKQDVKSAKKMQWYASAAINSDLDIQLQMDVFAEFVHQAMGFN